MYQVKCDDYILYDPRYDDFKLLSAKCNLEANTVCDGALTILHTHPYYEKLKPLKSIFEFKQDGHTLFRGRMTNNSKDFHKKLEVDLEGVLAFANDTFIPPFELKENTIKWDKYTVTCGDGENIVEFFLRWVLDRHNECVPQWQQLKVGTVTVEDPNNAIVRSSKDYETTFEIIKTRLFASSLGGYLYKHTENHT